MSLESRAASYIVSFAEKDVAKELGARWCPEEKVWFAPDETVARMMDEQGFKRAVEAVAFKVPFDDKEAAKKLGGVWRDGNWCARTLEQVAAFEK
eukprot:1967573-Pleurochrysis_carterae.AAC.1